MTTTNLGREASHINGSQSGAGVPLFVKQMGSGPPLVLLHGGPGAHHDYQLSEFGLLADEFSLYP